MSSTDIEGQPLTGDADFVKIKADRYTEIGYAITRSLNTLNRLMDADDTKSEAIDQLDENAKDVARDIGKAQERYALTASALSTYATSLSSAQDAAIEAIAAITTAQNELDDAYLAQTEANQPPMGPSTDPAADAEAQRLASERAAEGVSTAQGTLDAALGLWRDAYNAKVLAATTAANSISDVVNGRVGDQLNDSWWDDMGDFLDVLSVICDIAGVLAIFLAWVPFLGPILVGLAILGALITLTDSIIKFSRGEGSFSDIVFAAVGVVLEAFGGKIFSLVGKFAKLKVFTKVTKFGETGFLNSKAFKRVFGQTKTAFRNSDEMKNLVNNGVSFKSVFDEVANPFSGLADTAFPAAVRSGFGRSPLEGLGTLLDLEIMVSKTLPQVFSRMSTIDKISLGIVDFYKLTMNLDSLANAGWGDDAWSFSPHGLMNDGANALEGAITG